MTTKRTQTRRKVWKLATMKQRIEYIKQRYIEKPCPRCKSGMMRDGNCDGCGYGHVATVGE